MPCMGNFTNQTGIDFSNGISLLLVEPKYLFKLQKDLDDSFIRGITLESIPISPEVAEVRQNWNNAGADTVVPNFTIQTLEQKYTFRNRNEVIGFLENHPFLVSILIEAYEKIAKYFNEYPQIVLKVIIDPEVPDDRQLVASIKTRLSPEEALEKLDSFDSEWWLQSIDRARGELCINVEFP
jgi:hypothetical protein